MSRRTLTIEAHAVISSLAIEAPSSVKRYFSSTGLPGSHATSPVTPRRQSRPRIRCRALRVESHADLSPQGPTAVSA